MEKMKVTLKPFLVLKPYIDYWDEWHKEWYINASSRPQKLTPIKGWPIPTGNGGNKNEIWRYFPEPYWGNPNPTEITAVFLNLNPAGGGDDQDVIKTPTKDPITTYNLKQQAYSDTINILINSLCSPTTDWFIKNRVHWVNCLLHHLKKGHDKSIKNIIAGELVPWHTTNAKGITTYIAANINLITKHCIEPIAKISQCATLKGIVFCRGVAIAHLLNKLTTEKTCYTSTDGYRIHVFEIYGATFIVFVGGRNMELPSNNKLYNDNTNGVYSVHEIVNKYLKS